ncbi:MAG: hypothetical protein ACRD5Z_10830 [Bryobacteraceae bacterium]
MQQVTAPKTWSLSQALGMLALAGGLGFGAGWLMARIAPKDKFSWVGFAVVPLWFLLELYLEGVAGLLGSRSRGMRAASTVAVLAGFYVAWFAFRATAL